MRLRWLSVEEEREIFVSQYLEAGMGCRICCVVFGGGKSLGRGSTHMLISIAGWRRFNRVGALLVIVSQKIFKMNGRFR